MGIGVRQQILNHNIRRAEGICSVDLLFHKMSMVVLHPFFEG